MRFLDRSIGDVEEELRNGRHSAYHKSDSQSMPHWGWG